MQANAEGGLSERARERAVLVAEEADLRIRPPQFFLKELAEGNRDPRLPAVGTYLNREFQGRDVSVEVLEEGFRYQGASLSIAERGSAAGERCAVEWICLLFVAGERGATSWRVNRHRVPCGVRFTRENQRKKV